MIEKLSKGEQIGSSNKMPDEVREYVNEMAPTEWEMRYDTAFRIVLNALNDIHAGLKCLLNDLFYNLGRIC